MAKFVRLCEDRDQMVGAYFELCRLEAENHDRELAACTYVQRLWRGTASRLNLYARTFAALSVQRIYRGFAGRLVYAQRLLAQQSARRMAFYDNTAAVIQKRWRGLTSRKRRHDFYARKRYIEAILVKNELVQKQLDEHRERQMEEYRIKQEDDARRDFQRLLSDKHHLVSTVSMPGVFNSPFPACQPTAFGEYVDDHLHRTAHGISTRKLPSLRSGRGSSAPGRVGGPPPTPQRQVMSGALNSGSLQASSPYEAVDIAARAERRVSSAVRARVSPHDFRPTRKSFNVPHPPSVHAGPQLLPERGLGRPRSRPTSGSGGMGSMGGGMGKPFVASVPRTVLFDDVAAR